MPTLAEATSRTLDPDKYEPIAMQTSARPDITTLQGAQTFQRCPLPPVSVTPDSLRQFQATGIPQMRLMTPTASNGSGVGGSGSTTVFEGAGSSTTGGGSSGGGASAQTIQNASVTTPVLSQGQSIQIATAMATVFVLLRVTVNAPSRIRMYATKAAQAADLGRDASTPIVPGLENGILADFLLLANSELNFTCSPAVIGFNDDSTRVSTCYITIGNPVASSNAITASFSYAVLQN